MEAQFQGLPTVAHVNGSVHHQHRHRERRGYHRYKSQSRDSRNRKRSNYDDIHSKSPNQHYINAQGTWTLKSKSDSKSKSKSKSNSIPIANPNIFEYNKSSATILYCGPDAKCSDDVVEIKPNDVIPDQSHDCIRIIAMGCTHELHRHVYIPRGDLLIHAGDTCNWRRYHHFQQCYGYETPSDIWKDMVSLLSAQRRDSMHSMHSKKRKKRKKYNPLNAMNNNFKYGMVVIPGNHDLFAEHNTNHIRSLLKQQNIAFLVNEFYSVDIECNESQSRCNNKTQRKVLRIFGSPVSWYRNKPSCAYQLHRKRHSDLWNRDKRDSNWKYWDDDFVEQYFPRKNTEAVDIMITHGPPAGYGDCEELGRCTGSHALLRWIHRHRPKVFICCDYHGAGGEGDSHGYGVHFLYFKDAVDAQKKKSQLKQSTPSSQQFKSSHHDNDGSTALKPRTDMNDIDTATTKIKRGDYCILMNVAIAHQPARFMRGHNICRGVTIVDARINDLVTSNR